VDVKPATPLEQLKHIGASAGLVTSLMARTDAAAGDDLALPEWEFAPPVVSSLALTAAAGYCLIKSPRA